MTVKEILSDCLKKLNITNFLNEETFTTSQSAIANRLLDCLNLIYQEVVTDYFPLVYSESITLDGNLVPYSTLVHRLLKPISLKNDGKNIAFITLPTGIESKYMGTATLFYNYLPTELTLDSNIDDCRLTCGLLSDGVMGEYYFLDSVFELAAAYDNKFRKDLSWATTKGREIMIKPRRWGE
ncbi:MAG TPA: hypothetical protein VJZ69_02085 [Clostridia bacterium]|nr:hypothetical protein [Clostridia bacterium]